MHIVRSTSLKYSKIRQFQEHFQFDVCRHEVRYGCLREDSCHFAHSFIELKVWLLQQYSGGAGRGRLLRGRPAGGKRGAPPGGLPRGGGSRCFLNITEALLSGSGPARRIQVCPSPGTAGGRAEAGGAWVAPAPLRLPPLLAELLQGQHVRSRPPQA